MSTLACRLSHVDSRISSLPGHPPARALYCRGTITSGRPRNGRQAGRRRRPGWRLGQPARPPASPPRSSRSARRPLGRRQPARTARVAVGETVILLHPPLPSVGVSIETMGECQQIDSLANGQARTARSACRRSQPLGPCCTAATPTMRTASTAGAGHLLLLHRGPAQAIKPLPMAYSCMCGTARAAQ